MLLSIYKIGQKDNTSTLSALFQVLIFNLVNMLAQLFVTKSHVFYMIISFIKCQGSCEMSAITRQL